LVELGKKVFGNVETKVIIGAEPPENPDTKNILEKELEILTKNLESQPKENLEKLLEQQLVAGKHINSRPGAMALAQNKIQLFNKYNEKYVQTIKEKLQS
jgi:CII-binding regulator of phage lambda lysogenization HflD